MKKLKTSVLIPSYRRPNKLLTCLQSLNRQTLLPDEVIVVWQADDWSTKEVSEKLSKTVRYELRILHLVEPGIVPAENLALSYASGEVILLIDDDAVAPNYWIERHLAHYSNPRVGAVGGAANNFYPDGTPFPKRAVEPIGKLSWYGKAFGNMYDHVVTWQQRQPKEVDHLVGYNMSLRRSAFDCFENCLKPYWQMFETEVCLQVKAKGYDVIFDFANVVDHDPTNAIYDGQREGDLQVKIFNAAFNQAFILAKHSERVLRFARLIYLLLIGAKWSPGLLLWFLTVKYYGNPLRELRILCGCWSSRVAGWQAGMKARKKITRACY